jgi:N-acetyl-gamma-glutamyl-phosphate reductase
VTARAEAGRRLDDVHPRTRVPLRLESYQPGIDVDAAVVAYPHGAAAPVVAELRERGVRVVDLSADFRLRDRGIYEDWYGEHGAPDWFGTGVYGLPELTRDAVRDADLVANPGCYPTATLLGLAPLARAGVIGDVVIDAKSGVSGAGRAATSTTHFISADENVAPYKIEGHRHTPEIEQELAVLGAEVTITFTPHLLPLAQGELVSCYVTPARELGDGELAGLYDDAYAAEPFVELRDGPVGVLDVRDTNYCRISALQDPRTGRVIVFSAIDNLWKGAASQAVQNLNLMFGLAETEGLR